MAKRVMATRESVAYQEHVYTTAAPRRKEELRVVKGRAHKKRARLLRMQQVACFAVVIAIAGAILYNHMTLTQLTNQLSEQESRLADLDNEYISLKAQQDRSLSLDFVENYAQNNLGMVKMESGKTEYLEIKNPDRIEMLEQESGWRNVFSGLVRSIHAIVAYLQ